MKQIRGQAAGSNNGVICPEEEAGAGSRSRQKALALIEAPDDGTGEGVGACPSPWWRDPGAPTMF